jgi:hypothetical protein
VCSYLVCRCHVPERRVTQITRRWAPEAPGIPVREKAPDMTKAAVDATAAFLPYPAPVTVDRGEVG